MTFSDSPSNSERHARAAALSGEVRHQAIWAAISAVLLLYFGWGRGEITNYILGAAILDWTCKLGGFAMAASTLLLLSGISAALLFDAVASMAIGAAILVGGVLWNATGIDFQGILLLIFGYLFTQSGWHSYRLCRMIRGAVSPGAGYDRGFEARYDNLRGAPPPESLASKLRERDAQAVIDVEPVDASTNGVRDDEPDEPVDWSVESGPEPRRDTPVETNDPSESAESNDQQDAPDGFLASFADPPKDDPNR